MNTRKLEDRRGLQLAIPANERGIIVKITVKPSSEGVDTRERAFQIEKQGEIPRSAGDSTPR